MKTKLLSLFQDREFQFRISILLVIFIFMGWQIYTVNSQKKEIVVLKKEKQRKEAMLLANKNRKPAPTEQQSFNYRLEGTTIHDGTFQALINGVVYKVGDLVDQYKVTDISLRSSTLQNLNNQAVLILQFVEDKY